MTEEEIKRAINNPPYKIAIDNLYKCALEFCKAAKRYLENTDRSKQDELAQISRSKWASFCYSVDIGLFSGEDSEIHIVAGIYQRI